MQNCVWVKRQKLFALECGGQQRNALVIFVLADLVFIRITVHQSFQITLPFDGQALNQQTRRHIAIGCQNKLGIKLFTLQHVMLQHLADVFNFFMAIAKQGHHALVGLLTGKFIFGVKGNGAAAFVVDIN